MAINNKLYNLFIRNWFGFSGRSGRQEYIFRFLLMWFLAFVGTCLVKLDSTLEQTPFNVLAMFLTVLIIVPLFFLSIIQVFCVTHRRLHDLNASGWWQLITFIPLGQILMIGFIFFKGTTGPNRYGLPPENHDDIVHPNTTYEKDNASIITVLCLVTLLLFVVIQLAYDKRYILTKTYPNNSTRKEFQESALLASKASELMNNKKNKEALQYINQALELEPKNPEFLMKKSEILYNLKDYDESIKYLNIVLEEDPHNVQALGNLIAPLYELGRYEESVGICDKLISWKLLISNNHMFYAIKAKSLYKLKEYEEMLISLDIALSMKPDYKPALDLKSKALKALEEQQGRP